MASPFVPVPMPMERGPPPCGGAGKARRPQRASSLGSVSVNGGGGGGGGAESSPSAEGGTLPGRDSARAGQERGRTGPEGGTRAASGTPPPPTHHSPSPRVRVNGGGPGGGPGGGGGGLEPSVEYSTCPRSASDLPAGARPFTPTLLGYEVMEERAKFTVYKVLVRKSQDESWVVFRRYTDFSRLNDKLKEMFPGFRLSLPPKRWFKDNYDTDFLDDRQHGLQAFLQNLVAHKDIAHCLAVREFLCFDDPPGPFDSLEESRAFCETLEETNYRLQKEVQEKQKEIEALRRRLEEQEEALLLLQETHVKKSVDAHRGGGGSSVIPESLCAAAVPGSSSSLAVPGSSSSLAVPGSSSSLAVPGSSSSLAVPGSSSSLAVPGSSSYVESSTTEADQDLTEEESSSATPV